MSGSEQTNAPRPAGIGRRWGRPVIAALALSLFDCGGLTLESRLLDRAIVVDGRSDDWAGALETIPDRSLSIGAFNDDRDLYLCLVSYDESVNLQAAHLGLTLWFDASGGREESFGIEYPLVEEATRSRAASAAGSAATATGSAAGGDAAEVRHLAVRVTGPDDRLTFPAAAAPGIVVASERPERWSTRSACRCVAAPTAPTRSAPIRDG